MRGLFLLTMLLALLRVNAATLQKDIIFRCPDASEVYIVWGINGWQLPADSLYPAGSFVRDQVMYSPMTKDRDDQFIVAIPATEGAIIDFVFWVTKGALNKPADVWDLNAPHKDYHAYVSAGAQTIVNSNIVVQPKEPLTILDFSGPALTLSLLFGAVVVIGIRRRSMITHTPHLYLLSAVAVTLLGCLMLIRPSVLGISWQLWKRPADFAGHVLWASIHDVIYVLTITAAFLVPLVLLRRHGRTSTVLVIIFSCVALISLLSGLFNVRVVELLGKPFNYQWLYYADFLQTPDAQSALAAHLDGDFWLQIGLIILAAIVVTTTMYYLFTRFVTAKGALVIAGGFIPALAAFFFIAPNKIRELELNEPRIANPVTAFISSLDIFAETPELFTMKVEEQFHYKKSSESGMQPVTSIPGNARNILMIVLESVPAEYLSVYKSNYSVTPNIDRIARNAMVYENVYAHAPATNLSMVSLLNSIYPWLSYNSFTQEHPDLPLPSLTSVLGDRGYRTGFFSSADNRYQSAQEYLEHRGFQEINDCRDTACGKGYFQVTNTDWEYMDGRDDGCTASKMTDWIAQDTSRPFFAMMWTYQTHYPYFVNGKTRPHETRDTMLNRYLNALEHADVLIGDVMADLRKNNLDSSTMVVIVGDHGEAFGRHGQISHGRMIYEENLHIPCIIANPGFNEQRRIAANGGLIDVAPTLLHMLSIDAPSQWEGESFFTKTDDSRVYFFAPWSDFLFGFREKDRKYIFNATTNRAELYDLKTDPFESKNLAAKSKEEIAARHSRLAGWVQYVHRRTEHLINVSTTPFAAR